MSFAVAEATPADAADFPGGAANREISFPMVATGDMNGDGVDDIVASYTPGCCGLNGGVTVMLGNGDATFGEPGVYPVGGTGTSQRVVGVVLADFDEDDDLDVFATVPSRLEVDVWENDGSGVLSGPAFTTLTTRPTDDLKVADLDGDGHLDVVAAGTGDGSVTLFHGRGDGTFADSILATGEGTISTLVVGDFDGEESLDIAWASHFAQSIRIATATGARSYEIASLAVPWFTTAHLFAADLDDDDDVDLGATAFRPTAGPLSNWCDSCVTTIRGDGAGGFSVPAATATGDFAHLPDGVYSNNGQPHDGGPNAPDAVDIDGDDDTDLVFAFPESRGLIVVARNDGNGRYDVDQYVGFPDNSANRDGTFYTNAGYVDGTGRLTRGVAIADLDDDGALDMVVATEEGGAFTSDPGSITVVRGDSESPGDFLAPQYNRMMPNDRFARVDTPWDFADWNGDGIDDVVGLNGSNYRLVMFEGRADGTFTDAVEVHGGLRGTLNCGPVSFSVPGVVAAGDLDGDGHDDLLCRGGGPSGRHLSVLFGDGNGGADVVEIAAYGGAQSFPSLLVEDFDGDGDGDLLDTRITGCSPCTMSTVILRNNGDRTFDEQAAVEYGQTSVSSAPIVAVDLDGDDDLDLVSRPATGNEAPLLVRINDGDGGFSAGPSSAPVSFGNRTSGSMSLVAGDVNKDGDVDLIAMRSWAYQGIFGLLTGAFFVMTGNGDGTFDTPVEYDCWCGGSYGPVDVDGDGNLDLPINITHFGYEIARGNGDGTFELPNRFWTGSADGYTTRLKDLNGDTKPDLVGMAYGITALVTMTNTSTGAATSPDLEVVSVDAPTAATPGDVATVNATIRNKGTRASGSWVDQVWLSADETFDANDRLLGSFTRNGANSGVQYTVEVSAPLAPLTDGRHHVIVRADARGQLTETDELNNTLVDTTGTDLDIPELTTDGLEVSFDDADVRYAQLEAAEGEQLVVRGAPVGDVQIDAVRGRVPVPARELQSNGSALILPAQEAATTWFLRVERTDSGLDLADLELADLTFGIVSVSPSVIRNEGAGTLTIVGEGFTDAAAVVLVRDGDEVDAEAVTRADAQTLNVTFDFGDDGIEAGRYIVRVEQDADVAELEDAVNVVDEPAPPAGESTFILNASMPGSVRTFGLERGVPLTIEWRNTSLNDVPAAYGIVEGPGVRFDNPDVEGLDYNADTAGWVTEVEGGPAGITPAGAQGRLELRYFPDTGGWTVDVGLMEHIDTDVSEAIADEILPFLEPDLGDDAETSPVYARLLDELGAFDRAGLDCPCTTTGDYVAALNEAARDAARHGVRLDTSDERFFYVIDRALATTDGAPVGGVVRDTAGEPVGRADVLLSAAGADLPLAVATWYDGSFRIWDAPAGDATLRVDGFVPDPAVEIEVGEEAARSIDVEVERGGTVSGRVTRAADASPVEAARVEVVHGNGEIATAFSQPDGTYEVVGVTDGVVRVSVVAVGLAPFGGGDEVVDGALELDVALGAGIEVRGTVRDSGGEPIAGASALLLLGPAEAGPSVEAAADGSYELDGIPDGRWDVAFGAPGYAPQVIEVEAAGTDLTLDVVLEPEAQLVGQVTSAVDGTPVEGATVAVTRGSDDAIENVGAATTDANGNFTVDGLPAGALQAHLSAEALAPATIDVTTVAGETIVQNVVLAALAAISGTVRDDAGDPIAGTSVRLALDDRTAQRVATDGDGEFTFADLTPGAYEVVAGEGRARVDVDLDGTGDASGITLALDGARLVGRFVDDEGDAVADAVVRLFDGDGGSVAQTATDAVGRFEYFVFADDTYDLWLGASEAGVATVDAAVSTADDVVDVGDVTVGAGSLDVSLTVDGAETGSGTATLVARGSAVGLTQGVDESGVISFDGLIAGTYDLSVVADGAARRSQTVVIPATDDLAVDLEPGVSLTGIVEDEAGEPVGGVVVAASSSEAEAYEFALTGADGTYEVSNLAPADYVVRAIGINGSQGAQVDVTVAADAELDLTMGPLDTLTVRLVDGVGRPIPDGAVATFTADHEPVAQASTEGFASAVLPRFDADPIDVWAIATGRSPRRLADVDADSLDVELGAVIAVPLSAVVSPVAPAGGSPRQALLRSVTFDDIVTEVATWYIGLGSYVESAFLIAKWSFDGRATPRRNGELEEAISRGVAELNALLAVPDKEFCAGLQELVDVVIPHRIRAKETAFSAWQLADKSFREYRKEFVVNYSLRIAKVIATLFLTAVTFPEIAAALTTVSATGAAAATTAGWIEFAGGAGLLLSGFDALVATWNNFIEPLLRSGSVEDALNGLPDALTTWSGVMGSLNILTGALLLKFEIVLEEAKVLAKNSPAILEGLFQKINHAIRSGEPQSVIDGLFAEHSNISGKPAFSAKLDAFLKKIQPVTKWLGPLTAAVGSLLDVRGLINDVIATNADFKAALDRIEQSKRAYLYAGEKAFISIEKAIALARKDCSKKKRVKFKRRRVLAAAISVPIDPNEIFGPAGVGDARWLAEDPTGLGYEVKFENLGEGSLVIPPGREPATVPAVFVDVTLPIDPDLDLDSFELVDMGWDDQVVDLPDGTQSWSQRLGPFEQYDDLFVDVTADLDRATRTARWTFTAIDPETGNPPIDERGFLDPEDGTGNGQGFARYRVDATAGKANGTELTAKATIVFDDQEPLETNEWSNSIDTDTPSVALRPLPATTRGRDITVRWDGVDAGSGVAATDVYVSVDGGPLSLWRDDHPGSSAIYRGQVGRTYGFAAAVEDAVGHPSAVPTAVATSTRVVKAGARAAPPGLIAVGENGRVYRGDGATLHGDLGRTRFAGEIAGVDRTSTGRGYTIVTRTGHVYTFGNARYFGAPNGVGVDAPITDIAVTPSGRGYVIVAADGRVRSYGDAPRVTRVPAVRSPVVAVDLTPSGDGLVLLTGRGRVLAYGDADHHGSVRPDALATRAVDIDFVDGGRGYVIVERTGRLHDFGTARAGANPVRARDAVAVLATPRELGLWVVYQDGVIRHIGRGRPLRAVVGPLTGPLATAG